MGYRAPPLKDMSTSCGSGLLLSAAARDAVLPVPGSSENHESHKMQVRARGAEATETF